jgi:hypothetical protein
LLIYIRDLNGEPLLQGVDGLYTWYHALTREQDKRMAQDTAVQHLAATLTADLNSDREKAKAIFHWVQQEVRYIAFEEGLGGFVPREPGAVCQRRYGDCKDMATLCVALMRASGLEAERVWLGTRDLPYRYETVPTPMADNHMIAAVHLPLADAAGGERGGAHAAASQATEWVYLDATDPYLPFGYPASFIQGRPALIGRGSTYLLDTVPIPTADQNSTELELDLWLQGLELLGKGRIRLQGYPAMAWRQALSERKPEGRRHWVEDRLQLGSNRFQVLHLQAHALEDLDAPLELDIDFRIEELVSFVAAEAYLNPHLLPMGQRAKVDLPRKQPRIFDHRWSTHCRMRFHAPRGWTWRYPPDAYRSRRDGAWAEMDYAFQKQDLVVSMRMQQNVLELPAAEAVTWQDFWDGFAKRQRLGVVLSPVPGEAESEQPPVDKRAPALAAADDGSAAPSAGSGLEAQASEASRNMAETALPHPPSAIRSDFLLRQRFDDPTMDSLWMLPWPRPTADEERAAREHPALVLLDRRWTSFAWHEGSLVQEERVQVVLRAQNARGLERFNKVFLPWENGDQLLGFHAVLYAQQDGFRHAGDASDVLEVEASAEHDRYRQCALKGMRVGDVLAYAYVRRKPMAFFGRQTVQRNIPVLSLDLRLDYPLGVMDVETASYHGLPQAQPMLLRHGKAASSAKGIWRLQTGPLEPAYRARYARYEAELQRQDWRIKALPAYGMSSEDFSWCAAAERLLGGLGLTGEDSDTADQRAIEALLRELDLVPDQTLYHSPDSGLHAQPGNVLDQEERAALGIGTEPGSIRINRPSNEALSALERLIKERIGVLPDGAVAPQKLADILAYQQADASGMLRVFAACFRQLGWRYAVAMGASEEAPDLDPDFPQWQALQVFYLYLPALERYLAVQEWAYRDGLIPPAWADRPALHAFMLPSDSLIDAAPAGSTPWRLDNCAFQTVPEAPLEGQYEQLDLDIQVVLDASPRLMADAERSFSGLRAAYIRPYLPLMADKDRDALFQELLALGETGNPVLGIQSIRESPLDASRGEAWSLSGRVSLKDPIARAGPRYRIALGACIGPQVELYSERPRQFPIDVDHPHGYRRRLRLQVPEGYRLLGEEGLVMNRAVLNAAGDTVMAFRSSVALEDDVLTVWVHEFYRHTRHPARDDRAFRSVINAAADFNKRSVVLLPSADGRRP